MKGLFLIVYIKLGHKRIYNRALNFFLNRFLIIVVYGAENKYITIFGGAKMKIGVAKLFPI